MMGVIACYTEGCMAATDTPDIRFIVDISTGAEQLFSII